MVFFGDFSRLAAVKTAARGKPVSSRTIL